MRADADRPGWATPDWAAPEVEFELHEFDNGLRVILRPDHRTPLVHITVHYRVGSSYEEPGKSGFAHLFEHLMFQGSANVPRNEHGRLVDAAGGRWNATTSKDRTNYFNTLPSSSLNLGLWLEADRMASLQITQESFENQRHTVLEEKKQSYDNRPYGRSFLRFDDLCYHNWAYRHPVIGTAEDLKEARLEDVEAFHRKYYRPWNATLALSGDFDPGRALEEIRKHFDGEGNGERPPPPDLTEPEQSGERLEEITDRLAALSAVQIGFPMAAAGSPDSYALSVLALALASGESSRLQRLLGHEKNWITSLSAGPNGYRGPQLFTFWLVLQDGVQPSEAVSAVQEELDRVAAEPLPDYEMEKARNQIRFQLLENRRTVSRIGESLARFDIFFDDPGRINREAEKFLKVSPRQVREAAERTFRLENRNVLITRGR